MTRRLKDGTILGVCQLMSDTEVPELFSLWGGIVATGAVLGRNSWIDQGHFTVFPNLYVVLTAGSAKCRKSTIISKVEDLLRGVEPKMHLMSQKSTPEALIQDMCGVVPESSTNIITGATGIVIADEVSTFIDRNAFTTGMIPILTKLYDCKDFDYRTRSRGAEVIKNPCLSILGGSTIQWIKESIPIVSIGGGFTARIIFVYREDRTKHVPWSERTPETVALESDLIHDLSEIHKNVRGRFVLTPEAKEMYCSEYITFSEKSSLFQDANMAGYAGRRHVMILKLSMAFSASTRDDREVTAHDMRLAINSLLEAEKNMQRVLSAISCEPCGDLSEQLVTIIHRNKRSSKFELVRQFRHKLNVNELDALLRTLEEAQFIRTVVEGSQVFYDWIGKA